MILKGQLFLLGMMVTLVLPGVDSNTANFTLLCVTAVASLGGGWLKLVSDSRERRYKIEQDRKLVTLQATADNTHKLVNSDSEKQMALTVLALRGWLVAVERTASESKLATDIAAADAAKAALHNAEKLLADHKLAQAGVDAVEQHIREHP
jgi:hypothetical protein